VARLIEFEETPNPNALKCVCDETLATAPRSYRTLESAAGDALASALFAIPGIVGVFVCQDFVTVNKAPDADWRAIRKAAKKAIEARR